MRSKDGFRRYAWGVLAYTIGVILWGGFVRATGSGAGCGSHWPLCNGEAVPRSASLETLIEFSHRITSGLALLGVVLLVVWARRAYPAGTAERKGAYWSLFFMITEALVGAGLVLLEYVAYNVSVARGYWMAAHLINTFLLLAAMTLTAHAASGGGLPRWRGQGALGGLVLTALGGTLVLGVSGAIAALGDTLSLGGGLDPAEHPVVATLVGLRIYHPLLACLLAFALYGAVRVALDRTSSPAVRRLGYGVFAFYGLQMALGLLNVYLMAPVWLQMVHLLGADLLWITLLRFGAEALAAPRTADLPEPAADPVAAAS